MGEVEKKNSDQTTSEAARTFLVEVIHTKTYRVIVGGENGSVRIEGEPDEDAVEALVNDYVHLPESMLPRGIAIEQADCDIESIKEVIDAAPQVATGTNPGDR